MDRAGRSLQSSLRGKAPRERAPETPRSSSLPKRSDSGAVTEEMRAKPWPVIHIRGSGGSIAVDNFIHREPESSRWMAVNVVPKGSSAGQLIVPESAKGPTQGSSPAGAVDKVGKSHRARSSLGLAGIHQVEPADSAVSRRGIPIQLFVEAVNHLKVRRRGGVMLREGRGCLSVTPAQTQLASGISLRLRPAGAERHGPRREPIEV
jgi:hypothetical protein